MAKRRVSPRPRTIVSGHDEWDALEEALLRSGGKGGTRSSAQRQLDALFDPAEQDDLRRLAEHARLVRSRSPTLGNVVFLHGITGADLSVVDPKGDADGVWVNVMRIMAGRMGQLRLNADAKSEADPRLRCRATRVNQKYYAKAVLSLRARWNVEPYAYDWRRDIDEAADGLAELIGRVFSGQAVHLVAHSMGGLVARNFILRHAELWEAMRQGELSGGGRLVMLGTPNYGSFSIPPVLTGSDQLMELLERLDLAHNMPELLAITNTFLGSYMLLPAPGKLPPALGVLYQRDTWGEAPGISQPHLNRTYQFYKDLEQASTIDATRMVYVAGCRNATIASMNIVAPGDFEYSLSYDGDGRVPHALGLLPGVPVYYVDEVHGDLARNEEVLRAVDELLETGSTDELSTTLLRSRAVTVPKLRDYRTAADRRLMEELERIANKARGPEGPDSVTVEEQRFAADALVKAALGTNARSLSKPLPGAAEASARARRDAAGIRPVDLELTVRFGDVTMVKAPVVVVGHYRGVQPVNAIGAIDRALGGWITRAVRHGMISGHLGETFFVPTHGALGAEAVVVAGMGDYGQFSPASLRRLMANVALGAGALGVPMLASVLVGAGEGALDRDTALREMLEGLGVGLAELREQMGGKAVPLARVVLIERDPDRFFGLIERARALAERGGLTTVNLQVGAVQPADRKRANSATATARARAAGARAPQPRAPTGSRKCASRCHPFFAFHFF